MLSLKDIKKDYVVGDSPFLPLKASALIFVRMSSFLSLARQAVVKPLF